ncbi:hypothetical protein AVEN_272546-1 [Araneus ventricosus]|uniref:Uncharacterized protein n=1 Tax=Araneus ventricosus TaxID=182803 RepID=A0A4Y2E9G3_ARAVE|nr:hypothetical protein AVEN_272546-1 [Araneus ventricosus]
MRRTPELVPPLQTSAPQQREDVSSPTYYLTCNRFNTRQVFSGLEFRTWKLFAPRPTLYQEATAASSQILRNAETETTSCSLHVPLEMKEIRLVNKILFIQNNSTLLKYTLDIRCLHSRFATQPFPRLK